MNTRHMTIAGVGLISLAALMIAADVQTADIGANAGLGQESYALVGDSIFAEGCMGGGPFGCMCPLQGSLEFTGTFTMTPVPHVPQGHQAFDLIIEDWLAIFGDDAIEIAGTGTYQRWTTLEGTNWQRMALDLEFNNEIVHFDSGVMDNPDPGGGFPATIDISLDNGAECYGYVIFIQADLLPAVSPQLSALSR